MLRDVIVCLGDSLTWGSRDIHEGRGYPAWLPSYLETLTRKICIAVNEGEPRETSSDTLRRAYKVMRSYPEAQLVIVMVGTNDLKSKPPPVDIYQENMRQIVNIARVCGKKIIVGLLPPAKSLGMWCFPPDVEYAVCTYNAVLRDLAVEMRFPLANFSDFEQYLCDGVHLTPEGYRMMAARFAETISKEL
jgi:lysophospholipase L1-like esterase